METFNFTANRVFDDRYSAFMPQAPQAKDGLQMFDPETVDTGVKVNEAGDVSFGFYAPNARQVNVVFGMDPQKPLKLTKDSEGVWRATLPYDATFRGPKAFYFDVDGALVLSPYCPQYFSHNVPINYVEIPDPATTFILMRDVPHGSVATEFYWSDALNDWQRCLVYTPPGYQDGGQYPVLYLQHGGGENETSWVYNGRASHIMDNLIADKKATPCIVVMCNGMVRAEDEGPMDDANAFAATLIDNCIPFIDRKYRTRADKWHRGIAGFSMGSMQSSVIGLSNPDKFAYIGLLSGYMRRIGRGRDQDLSKENNPHLRIMDDKERFLSEIKLYYRGIGSRDEHYEAYEGDDLLCAQNGYDQYPNIHRNVVEGYRHEWGVLRILLHDFVQRIFKE